MEIRHLNSNDDLSKISHIYEESWKYAYKNIIPQTFLDSIPCGNWIPHLKDPEMNILVMLDNGKFIGVSTYCRSRFSDFHSFGEIVSIYLLPEYMDKGIGKQLLDKTISELSNLHFKNIFLWVLEENIRAIKFYEKSGFVLSGKTLDDNIGGKPLKETAYIYNI